MSHHIITSLTLPEIFEKVATENTIEEKASRLSKYHTNTLRWFVNALYNGDYTPLEQFIPADLKLNQRDPAICNITLQNAIGRIDAALYYYNTGITKVANKNIPIVMEELSASEAQLLIKLFKGERKIEGVSKAVFKRVYPDFFQ